MADVILKLQDVHAFYGKSHVLHGVNLVVHPGEIVALLGRNGVGRSTIGKSIMNMVRTEGRIEFLGERIDACRTFEIAQKGIGFVPESRDVFPTLTVGQNLRLGQMRNPRQARPRWTADDMYRLFPRLKEREHTPAGGPGLRTTGS